MGNSKRTFDIYEALSNLLFFDKKELSNLPEKLDKEMFVKLIQENIELKKQAEQRNEMLEMMKGKINPGSGSNLKEKCSSQASDDKDSINLNRQNSAKAEIRKFQKKIIKQIELPPISRGKYNFKYTKRLPD